MHFQDWSSFWHMGGHGPYVWAAYGIALTVLVLLIWLPLRRQRKLKSWLRAQQRRRS